MVSVIWMPDHETNVCMQCNQAFSLTLRRHHCRVCGDVVCKRCLRTSRVTAEWQKKSKPVKVCKGCRGAAWQRNEDAAECRACEREFNLRIRRHHCRRCGRIYCKDCSSYTQELPSSTPGVTKRLRVCVNCFSVPVDSNSTSLSARDDMSSASPASPAAGMKSSFFSRLLPSFSNKLKSPSARQVVEDDDLSLGSQTTPTQIELEDIEEREERNGAAAAKRNPSKPAGPVNMFQDDDDDDDAPEIATGSFESTISSPLLPENAVHAFPASQGSTGHRGPSLRPAACDAAQAPSPAASDGSAGGRPPSNESKKPSKPGSVSSSSSSSPRPNGRAAASPCSRPRAASDPSPPAPPVQGGGAGGLQHPEALPTLTSIDLSDPSPLLTPPNSPECLKDAIPVKGSLTPPTGIACKNLSFSAFAAAGFSPAKSPASQATAEEDADEEAADALDLRPSEDQLMHCSTKLVLPSPSYPALDDLGDELVMSAQSIVESDPTILTGSFQKECECLP
ncbi:Lateral signaling target protein 2 [Diplonema papillatum]|nr:Lateral signaling target protein 2 [Diplonema papillatum]